MTKGIETLLRVFDPRIRNSGYCAGLVHGQHAAPKPMQSFVHLDFTCNVLAVNKRSVMATFERAIHVFSRPIDPDAETGAHQVCKSAFVTFS